jgi:phospholipid/cholesterol/gamma-HCH transport system substrate-binding protein
LKISNETKIGALAVIAVALLIIGFNILKGNNLFSRTQTLYALYDNVSGLAPANPVQVNGLKIGTVTNLEVTNSGVDQIRVKLSIQPGIDIPQNSVARIVSADLLGSKAIVIDFGNATEYLQNNDTIQSAPGSSLTSNLIGDLKPLAGKVQNTLTALDTVLNDFHTSLDNQTRNNLKSSIAELNTTMKNFSKVSQQLDLLVKNLNTITGNLKNNNDTINRILSNTQRITSSIASADITGTINDLHQSVNELDDVMTKINTGQGSLGMMLNDKKLYNNLSSFSYNLNLLSEDLRLNPKRYVHFSLFGKKSKPQPLPGDTLKQTP